MSEANKQTDAKGQRNLLHSKPRAKWYTRLCPDSIYRRTSEREGERDVRRGSELPASRVLRLVSGARAKSQPSWLPSPPYLATLGTAYARLQTAFLPSSLLLGSSSPASLFAFSPPLLSHTRHEARERGSRVSWRRLPHRFVSCLLSSRLQSVSFACLRLTCCVTAARLSPCIAARDTSSRSMPVYCRSTQVIQEDMQVLAKTEAPIAVGDKSPSGSDDPR